MNSLLRRGALGLLGRFLGRLRFPTLFLLTSALFLLDVAIPDFVPFIEEIMLGLLALLFAKWKDRSVEEEDAEDPAGKPPEKNVTPGAAP